MVNLILALGAIFYSVVPIVMWAFSAVPESLSKLTILAALLNSVGTLIRCLSFIDPKAWWALWAVCIGQTFVACCGPIVMTAPPKLSEKWFDAEERTIATAISSSVNNLGSGVGFVVAPYLTTNYGIQNFLIIEAAVGAFAFLLTIVYFPDAPPQPPSITANSTDDHDSFNITQFGINLKQLLMNISFIVLVLVGGWQSGLLIAWQGMFDTIFMDVGSEEFVGWLGFFFIAASTLGSVIGGILCDKLWQRKFKLLLIVLFAILSGLLIIVTLTYPSFLAPHPPIPNFSWLTSIVLFLAGIMYGFCGPIFYELSVELTYPLPTAMSSGIYTLLINIAALIVLLVGPDIRVEWITGMAAFSLMACLIPLLLIKERYRRADIDAKSYVQIEK